MVTKRNDDRQPGEYRAICLGKVGRQSFAKNGQADLLGWLPAPRPLQRSGQKNVNIFVFDFRLLI